EARIGAAPILRRRVVATPLRVAAPVWLDDPDFDIARHVTHVETGGPRRRAELSQIVASMVGQPLDRSPPLWHLGVVEQLDDGSMALIWRVHHCMADGTACMRIGSSVIWSESPDRTSPATSMWTPE